MEEALDKDLDLDQSAILAFLNAKGINQPDLAAKVQSQYIASRASVMSARIHRELDAAEAMLGHQLTPRRHRNAQSPRPAFFLSGSSASIVFSTSASARFSKSGHSAGSPCPSPPACLP